MPPKVILKPSRRSILTSLDSLLARLIRLRHRTQLLTTTLASLSVESVTTRGPRLWAIGGVGESGEEALLLWLGVIVKTDIFKGVFLCGWKGPVERRAMAGRI